MSIGKDLRVPEKSWPDVAGVLCAVLDEKGLMTSAKYEVFDDAFYLLWQVRVREDEVKLAYQVPGFAARLLAWLGGLSRPTLYSENWPLHDSFAVALRAGDQVAALRADSCRATGDCRATGRDATH